MAVVSIVQLSELEGAKRIDAEYYQPEFDLIKTNLAMISQPLQDLISYIKHPAEIKRIYEEEGVPYVLAENITQDFWILQFTEKRYIPEETASKIPQNKLEIGDVLVTRTGANYGNASVYLGKPYPAYASAHIIIVRPHAITGEYLATYFNTYYGRKLIKRGWYGSSQPEISPEYLKKLPVARLDIEKEITNVVREAYKLMERSQSIYTQAENFLLEELGVKDFKPKYERYYTANFSEALAVRRIDAEYFQPVYSLLIDYLRSEFEILPLEAFVLDLQKGIEVGSENYREEGKPFFRVSNLSVHGFVERDQKYIDEELYQKLKDSYEPQIGDLLLTKDATPGIAYVVKEQTKGIISSGILRLRIDKNQINAEYLALCINSIIGKLQIERDSGGSVITHWKPEQIKNLQVPILPRETQQKIAMFIKQSDQTRKKAKELLDEAKRKIEEEIAKQMLK